jgi:hypothetical protein
MRAAQRAGTRPDRARLPRNALPEGRVPQDRWRELIRVRLPAHPELAVDGVLVGPTGIFVVVDVASGSPVAEAASVARRSSEAVAELLPGRYRHELRPVALVRAGPASAETVDGVLVATAQAFDHVRRASASVLSSSEVVQVFGCLDRGLVPQPGLPVVASSRSPLRRTLLASAVAAAVAAAALVATPHVADVLRLR